MDRFSFERYELVISHNRYEYYTDEKGYGLVDDYEDEEVMYLWAIYDGREGHMKPIGYTHTADQAQMICNALNYRPPFELGRTLA